MIISARSKISRALGSIFAPALMYSSSGNPLATPACASTKTSWPAFDSVSAPHNPRLLILDEDRIILQSLSQFLLREGYEVKTTDDAADALAQLEATQFELLIADINMPGVKSADFLRDIRRRFPQTVVVII